MAIVLGDLERLGLHTVRSELETAVKLGDHGVLNDSRYFLKVDVKPMITPGQYTPKSLCRKMRCCSIDKSSISEDVLDRLLMGKPDIISRVHPCMIFNIAFHY